MASALGHSFALPSLITRDSFQAYLLALSDLPGIADVLVQSDDYVFAKIHGVQTPVSDRRVDPEEVERVLSALYGETAIGQTQGGRALDFRATVQRTVREGVSFRANATRCRVGNISDGISITLRYITDVPRPFGSLGLEPGIVRALFPHYGLVLVGGITGSGKSTILSSTVREVLEGKHPRKVIAYEDPVEYTYQRTGEGRMPKVSQVEIGPSSHLADFHQAGPNAMRRGSDVILLGEMRDRESVMAGMELASTGHAVYATLHVETPAQAIDRVISFFPFDIQPMIASKLRSVLRLVLTQKQFPLLDESASARVRSWLVFDREVKAAMGRAPISGWEPLLNQFCRDRSTDFDGQAEPYLAQGQISFETYCELTAQTPREARNYLGERHAYSAARLDALETPPQLHHEGEPA